MIAQKNAIALLITLFFIMMITLSIGIGLKQVRSAGSEVKKEISMLQTSVILDDVMEILNNTKELSDINSSDDLQLFFNTISFPIIPLGNTNLKVGIDLSSARSKFNINSIVNENSTLKAALESYLGEKMIHIEYLDMLEDVIVGIKEDELYKTDIFYDKPYLFKDKDNYIASMKNLQEINKYYKKTYNNNKIDIINFENLFSFTKDNNNSLDLNCATKTILDILDLSEPEAYANEDIEAVVEEDSYCSSELCDSLTEIQKDDLLKYRATCTPQMFIDVVIDVMDDNSSATIKFEYDIVTRKGSNFVYEI